MEKWELDVLAVPYRGPYGGRDAHGEYFTPYTDLWLERITRRPVIYYHGLAEESTPEVIGEELGWERREDGVWFRIVLDHTKALARQMWEAAQEGAARASSGAIGHLCRVAPDGRILEWAMAELSLIDAREHQPANPYAVALARAKASFKAAGLAFNVNDYQKEHPMDENTIRTIVRQEVGTAVSSALYDLDDHIPEPRYMTGDGTRRRAPAVISERGEPNLTANGTPFVDAIKAMRQGRFETVRFQLSGKALSEGTDSAGGYLVPVEHSSQLIEMLRTRAAVRAAGATVIPMNSDTLQIPAQAGGATAYWVAENSAITASDQTWDQVTLQAKKLAALTKLSSELFEDSDPGVERLVMEDLARVLALEEDTKFLRGDGTGSTPTGLENISGVTVDTTTLGIDGSVPNFDHFADMLYALDAADVPSEGRAWVVHPRTVNTMRQLKDINGTYLWADPAQAGDLPTLWGYPVITTTGVPINETQGSSTDTSTIVLGHWPSFLVGQRKALELRASDAAGNAFEYDQVFIRAIMRVDCNVRHAAAFQVLKGARA